MFHFYMPGELSEAEEKAWMDREVSELLHVLSMLELGLAERRAGLIWFIPLCHDGYDY